jgi:hypothetical protein
LNDRKLDLDPVERVGDALDVGQCKPSMLIFLVAPRDPGSNRDRVRLERPPTAMRKQVADATRRDRALEDEAMASVSGKSSGR